MAQLDIFKRERELAKKAQTATRQPTPAAPAAAPESQPSGPSMLNRAGSYLADKLKPQQSIDTSPRTPGTPVSPFAKAVKRGPASAQADKI